MNAFVCVSNCFPSVLTLILTHTHTLLHTTTHVFSSIGKRVAVATTEGTVLIYSAANLKVL